MTACRVGKGPELDAFVFPPSDGGGLAERYLSETVPPSERPLARDLATSDEASRDGGVDGSGAVGKDAGLAATCETVDGGACKVGEACYPLPLGGPPNGRVACATEGLGDDLSLCMVENDCDRDHYCEGAGDVGGLCRRRCDPRSPTGCARGTQCWAFAGWLTAGVCR